MAGTSLCPVPIIPDKMSALYILPLDDLTLADESLAGPKAAILGQLRRTDIAVPPGFVIPSTVFEEFVRDNGLQEAITEAERLARDAAAGTELAAAVGRLGYLLARAPLPESLVGALQGVLPALLAETGAVVVRSSAIGEDRPESSGAGQHLTVLNVRQFGELLTAVRRCWASLFSVAAIRYRARLEDAPPVPRIAVIVQSQIICEAAGVIFTRDPVDGDDRIVVEAVWGMGEALALGEVTPDRYVLGRDTLAPVVHPRIGDKRCQRLPNGRGGTRLVAVPRWRRRRAVLDRAQLGGLALLGLKIERILDCPADIEWGLAGGRWYIFQARPITALPPAPTQSRPAATSADEDSTEWTSSFLNERFSEPVSPLGWSIIRSGLEQVAFRETLEMIGVAPRALEPLTRLWRGRPYVRVAVYEALYKLFPDFLLPEDAHRFFPGGRADRRKRASCPRALLAPASWRGLVRAISREPAVLSPLHHDRSWKAFEREYVAAMERIGHSVAELERAAVPGAREILALIEQVDAANMRLLRIHRWSLTYAEVSYTLLRRLARRLLGDERGAAISAAAVSALDDYSMQVNRALSQLARLNPDTPAFAAGLREFLDRHGHRSFSLDLARPGFAADPTQVLRLIEARRGEGTLPPDPPSSGPLPGGAVPVVARVLLAPLAVLARRYARLRENQRYTWQRGLAHLRRLYLLAGRLLVSQGRLARPEDVFFLTADEVQDALCSPGESLAGRVALRAREYEANRRRADYPAFLRGDHPLSEGTDDAGGQASIGGVLRGVPASPGIGRGRARVVTVPEELEAVRDGEVLVARAADPGWTVVFDRVAALALETGGQLSHAAVVAREYRLPAVVAVAGLLDRVRTGAELIVDGTHGTIQIVPG
jgi:phosphohistidine swiveling domain-containing protein